MFRKLFALLLMFSSSPVLSDDPVRRDSYEDPLPDGAIQRLGTTRFRPSRSYRKPAFAADGKTFATINDAMVTIWDMNTGQELRWCKLPGPYECADIYFFS